jgi:demethylmenaquinone methyltransferase/2-methoxy-6-polyprenyl-1,4-benzoquinol methylase
MDKLATLQGLDVHGYLRDTRQKQLYVNTVFETVATSYDRFTRLCSMGLDMVWKRELLALVRPHLQTDSHVLDLATGTGDLVFALACAVREGKLIGIDISEKMIGLAEEARRRRKVGNAEFRVGDMMHLDLPTASVDVVTVSYGLRNCPDVRLALGEIHRVLKPGGFCASLDFVRPSNALEERLFLGALLAACNFFGWLWHRQPAAYGYLAHSIAHFVDIRELSRTFSQTGFQVLAERPKFFGTVAIHLVRKRGEP